MNKKLTPFLLSAALITFPNISYALRCGNELANVGDLKHEVLLACGKPKSKEIIGYIDKEKDGDRIRVMKLEEWIIKINNFYYSLIFEGNKLIKIESAGKDIK
ncbi:MAG: DUF2845 domain-containing protein [Gammaproteobacteria bacterium]|nr:DUF2845 domain-containing protein [Gammaproteobacteria bacterium]